MLIISHDVTVYVNGYAYRLAYTSHRYVFAVLGFDVENEGVEFLGFPHWDYDTPDKFWTNITLAVAEGYQLLYIHADRVKKRCIRLSPQDLVAQNSDERIRWDSYWENALDILCRPDLYPCLPRAARGTLGFLLLWGSMFVLP